MNTRVIIISFCILALFNITACSTNSYFAAPQKIENKTKSQTNTGNTGPKLLPSTNSD